MLIAYSKYNIIVKLRSETGDSMTNKMDNDNMMDAQEQKRLNRRRLLRAGAIAAPVALTLHGGVPLAHADSAGMCALKLQEIANNSNDRALKYCKCLLIQQMEKLHFQKLGQPMKNV